MRWNPWHLDLDQSTFSPTERAVFDAVSDHVASLNTAYLLLLFIVIVTWWGPRFSFGAEMDAFLGMVALLCAWGAAARLSEIIGRKAGETAIKTLRLRS